MDKDLIIISVGGSLIVPDEIDIVFLKSFKKIIQNQIKKGKRFIIVCGGGKLARDYQKAAGSLSDIKKEELDWMGIQATVINAHLLKIIFGKQAYPEIIRDPIQKIKFKEKILLAAGWKPGFSTDYDAVLLAENFEAKKILNLTDIDYIYDKDPDKFKEAKPIKKISWKRFINLIPEDWKPGLNFPFDPVAARKAKELSLEVSIVNGKKRKRINDYLNEKDFVGTKIIPD